ncbi:MAG: hypothetical protein WA162_00210, partial [Thermodesulfobacteriota bacterium]
MSLTIPSLKELDAALLKAIESFSSASALGETTKKTAEENKTVFQALGESLGEYYGKYFIETEGKTEAEKIKASEDIAAATESEGAMKIKEASLKSLGAVHSSVYKGMEEQMLSLVETGKFSLGAMGKVIAMQVKMELVGLAAKAAVWAIFETAMGFATLWINPSASATHFKSAATFGLVAGASLAAAAGVNSLLGKSKDSSSGAVSSSGRSLSAYPAPLEGTPK